VVPTARILVFTGDGKGKTTAALGMALRAAGHDMRVAVIQFIKNDPSVGELRAARDVPNIEIVQTGLGFVPPPTSQDFVRHQAAAQRGLRKADEVIAGRRHSLVILDEICLAVAKGLIEEWQVLEVIREAGGETCVVLTGRGATEGLVAAADTVTEMRSIKHGFQRGHGAQKGVEL
jgi:cob(I)alamin adenosyltransferase